MTTASSARLTPGLRADGGGIPIAAHQAQGLEIVLADEQLAAREQLVQHDAQREDVGARVGGLAVEQLGRDVGHLALHHAGVGDARRSASTARAMPKSTIFTVPFQVTMMLGGVTSR